MSQYCASVRCWTENGHHLSQATPQQLERELGLRHPLHRKKLQLAIAARLSGNQLNTPLARLDHAWVLRWLDDVGLPQYKDAFSEARIDGRVLNCLTYDDLAFLRFTNLLHVTSLKRGIQVSHYKHYDVFPMCHELCCIVFLKTCCSSSIISKIPSLHPGPART